MPKLTTENTLVLPEKHAGVGPHDHEAAWFRKSLLEPGNDREIIDAIIAKGIGSRPCPTPRDWAAFAVAGSIIAALTDKYITPPDPEPPEWVAYEMVHMLWGTLWQSVEENKEELDQEVLAAILREFQPRWNDGGPYFSGSHASFFEQCWSLEYPDTGSVSICNVRISRLKRGEKAFKELKPKEQAAIRKIARHMPTMLRIANQRVRKTFRW